MSNFTKNMSAAQTAPRHGLQNVRTLVSCALLAAVSVVRLLRRQRLRNIPRFSNRRIGAKDPPKAAGDS